MGDIDIDSVRQRAEQAADARNTAARNAQYGIGVGSSHYDRADASARDVPALLDALASAEARTRELEATVQRVEALHFPVEVYAYDDVNGVWKTDEAGEMIVVQRVCNGCCDDDALEDISGCSWWEGDSRFVDSPCATIRALRGSDV